MQRWLDAVYALVFCAVTLVVVMGTVYAWQVRALPVTSFFAQLQLAHEPDDWGWLGATWWAPEDQGGTRWRVMVDAGPGADPGTRVHHQLQVTVAVPDHYMALTPIVPSLQSAVACRCAVRSPELDITYVGQHSVALPAATDLDRDLLNAAPFVQWLLGGSILCAILALPFMLGPFAARALGGCMLVIAASLWCLPVDLPIVWWVTVMQLTAPAGYVMSQIVALASPLLVMVASGVWA